MVSLRKKFVVSFFISALVLVCLLMPAELKAAYVQCCKNGKLSICPDPGNGQSYDLSGCQTASILNPIVPGNTIIDKVDGDVVVRECQSGNTENKYTASGCSYSTSTRTCCSNGSWSEWDGECDGSSSCSSGQCWNGTICEDKGTLQSTCQSLIPNTVSGNLTRTAECVSGSGWKYGGWDGECECAEGYSPDEDSDLTCHETRYNWKIFETETADVNPYNENNCEDAAYSDTHVLKILYGIADAESVIGSDCTKWLEEQGSSYGWFNIWRSETCYRYLMYCIPS